MNLHYTIYDLDTGEILRNIQVPDEKHAQLQVNEGEGLLQMKLDYLKHYVIDGRVRELTPEEAEVKANPPSANHTWNPRRRRWEDRRPASVVIAERRAAIKAQIVELEAGQHRAVREAVLTDDDARLHGIEASIAYLRRQLAVL